MKKILKISIFSLCTLLSLTSFASVKKQASELVLVSGSLINNTTKAYGRGGLYMFISAPMTGLATNISNSQAPAIGTFIIEMPVGSKGNTRISFVDQTTNYKELEICTFEVEAISSYNAKMKMINNNTSGPILCSYTGDLNSDTAKITLIDNPNFIKKN